MKQTSRRCAGKTSRGERCRLHALEGTRFCRHHLPEDQKITRFLEEHWEGIVGLLLGGAVDSAVGDSYDYLKSRLRMKHFAPPMADTDGRSVPLRATSQHYRRHKDCASLVELVSLLRVDMWPFDVTGLLGEPDEKVVEESLMLHGTLVSMTYYADKKDFVLHLWFPPRLPFGSPARLQQWSFGRNIDWMEGRV